MLGFVVRQVVLDGVFAGFTGTNSNGLVDGGDENLAVADTPGLGGIADRLYGFFRHVVGHNDFDFHFWQKIHYIFCAAIKLGMALLAAKTLYLGNCYPLKACVLKGLFDLIKFKRLYNSFYFFSRDPFSIRLGSSASTYARPVPVFWRELNFLKKQSLTDFCAKLRQVKNVITA